MPKNLTIKSIEALRPKPGARYVHWDAELKGFGVRVSAGVKSYVLKYRLPSGRVRWKTYGTIEKLALEKVRKFAKDDIGIVARGQDPLETFDAARDAVTVKIVGERFLEDYVIPRRKPSTVRQYREAINNHVVPLLGSRPIAEVGHVDAVRLHESLRKTPIQANRIVAVLSKLIAWSMTRSRYRPAGPNPCRGIEKYPERKRKVYLNPEQYARLGRALRTVALQPAPKAAIELLLLTGARPAEIASLKWDHVDLSAAALNLPDSKTGEKVIHLSPPAVRLLKRWPKFAKSSHVFPGNGRKKKGEHMHASTLTHAWEDLREAAKLDDVRLYDACRHSYASVAVSQHGLTLAQIGAQLGHSQPATTARYAHLHDDVAKQHATEIGGSIAAALGRKRR